MTVGGRQPHVLSAPRPERPMQDLIYDIIIPRDWPSSAPTSPVYGPPSSSGSFPPPSSPPASLPLSSSPPASSSTTPPPSSSSETSLSSLATTTSSGIPTDGAQSAPASTTGLTPSPGTALADFQVAPVCIGHGVDAQSLGLLSALVVPTAVGLLILVRIPCIPVA